METSAPILAVHLTQIDLSLFGLGKNQTMSGGNFRSLLTPSQFHFDVLDRYKCIKTFVEVTILAASNLTASAKVLAKWVRVADETKKRLRNYFGFYAIASTIGNSPHLACWTQLWSKFEENHSEEFKMLNGSIAKSANKMTTNNDLNGEASLPHIIPLGTIHKLRQQTRGGRRG